MAEFLEGGSTPLTILVPNELATIRPDLQRFFDAMVYKLRRNKHKGRWEDLNVDKTGLLLDEEMEELRDAIRDGSTMEILMEAADVANFAMIMANISLEAKEPERDPDVQWTQEDRNKIMSRAVGMIKGPVQARDDAACINSLKPQILSPDAPGTFEGDLWYGDANNRTRVTHKWSWGDWYEWTETPVPPAGYANGVGSDPRPIADLHTDYEERRGGGKDVL